MRSLMKHVLLLGNQGGAVPPAVPANLAVTGASAGVVGDLTPEFTWDAVVGADTYEVEYGTTLTGTPTVDSLTDADYTVPTDLANFTSYSVKVRARGAGGASAWSDAVAFMPKVYLYRDEFATDASAPLSSPLAAEPGPGEWSLNNDSSNVSKSGGKLLITNSASRSIQVASGNLTRFAGLAYVINGGVDSTSGDSGIEIGYLNTSNARLAYLSPRNGGASSNSVTYNTDSDFLVPTHDMGAAYNDYAVVLRSNGAFFFAKIAGAWTLVWLDSVVTTTPIRFAFWPWISSGSTHVVGSTQASIAQLPAPFTTDNGIASLDVATPVSSTEYIGAANAIIDLTVTAPGSLDGEATTRCGFYYRADADLTPAWHCYVDGTGAFNLDSIASDGTRTNRITAAGVITGGGTRTLRVFTFGALHDAYTLSGTAWTKRGNQINVSLNDAATTIEPEIPAGWSSANLRCYPRTSSAYDVLSTLGN